MSVQAQGETKFHLRELSRVHVHHGHACALSLPRRQENGARPSSHDQTFSCREEDLQARVAMGAIHKMAATLGDSPSARPLRGNFSSLRCLPHLAKYFFLGFLFLLRAEKNHLFGSTHPSRHNADFCFHWAKWTEKGLRERQTLAYVGNLWWSSGDWRRYFGKT